MKSPHYLKPKKTNIMNNSQTQVKFLKESLLKSLEALNTKEISKEVTLNRLMKLQRKINIITLGDLDHK